MDKLIAHRLLEMGAVTLNVNEPFTWASGIKSPIYCDNRITLSFPQVRTQIAEGLSHLIKEHFSHVELIAGCATAGIPYGTLVSDKLQLPFCYVRSKAKEHGRGKQIEGLVKEGQKVVVIEDLISTGGSVLKVFHALKEAGCEVLGIVSIFTYELEIGKENFQSLNIPVYSLTNYSTLIQVAEENGYIDKSAFATLIKWRKDPTNGP